jgi:hypothetical protein
LLNDYLTAMSDIAQSHSGTIDKFIGDAILIFFGDPETKGEREDARACLTMAFEMQKRLAELNAKWRNEGIENPFRVRMGIISRPQSSRTAVSAATWSNRLLNYLRREPVSDIADFRHPLGYRAASGTATPRRRDNARPPEAGRRQRLRRMFWFMQKTFIGSYFSLSAIRRGRLSP